MKLAWRSPSWRGVDYCALDLETGGLNAKSDPILSIGIVPIRNGVIMFGESFYTLIEPESAVNPDSLLIHHILPDDLLDAPPLNEALENIDGRLRNAVLIVHHSAHDVLFLKTAYRKTGLRRPRMRVVDTMKLLLRLNRRHSLHHSAGSEAPLRLAEARAHFGLPAHEEHHALADAIATAELFLLLSHRLGVRTLRQLL
jgi:DNA polymerase-3 subunit epsilon